MSSVLSVEIADTVAAQQAVMVTLGRLDDAAARGPSLLPGWTRAHVVAHLARHADSHRRVLEGVLRGDTVMQYPGGEEGRAHEIELSARQPAAALVDDFRRAGEELLAVWERMPVERWDVTTDIDARHSGSLPAAQTVRRRWRELEIHHADLDLGFGPQDWPEDFVWTALPPIVAGLRWRPRLRVDEPIPPFVLEATDGPGAWLVEVRSDVTEVTDLRDRTGSLPAEHGLRGPGWALLSWLLGRVPLDRAALEVRGDGASLAALPATHPYH